MWQRPMPQLAMAGSHSAGGTPHGIVHTPMLCVCACVACGFLYVHMYIPYALHWYYAVLLVCMLTKAFSFVTAYGQYL